MKRICHIFDRPFEQENTAGFQRSNDLDSFVRGKAVGGDAEARQLAVDSIPCYGINRIMETFYRVRKGSWSRYPYAVQ